MTSNTDHASLSLVLDDVAAERHRQDTKWGGAEHDDGHRIEDFVQLIQDYAGWARVMSGMGAREKARNRLVQVAALAVAAVESIDRRFGTSLDDLPPIMDQLREAGAAA